MRPALIGVFAVLVLAGCSGVPGASPQSEVPSVPATSAMTPSEALATVTPATTTPVDDIVPATASSPAVVGSIGLDWARVHSDPAQWGTSLVQGPAGWIHMLTTDGEIPSTPRLMLSDDLRSWEDVTPAGDVVACGDGGGFAASTTTYLLRCGGLWRSADGRTWAPVDARTSDGIPADALRYLVSDGSGFVATTGRYPPTDGVWASADGSTWTKHGLPGASYVRMDALVAKRAGGYLLAGRVADSVTDLEETHGIQWESRPGIQALWESDDGRTWTTLPLGEGWEDARISGLAADGPGGGLLAVGLVGGSLENGTLEDQVPAIWRSTDGVAWHRLTGPTFEFLEADPGATRVVSTDARWLVLATRTAGSSLGVAAGSEDGTAWWSTDPVPIDEDGYVLNDLVSTGDQLVALGAGVETPTTTPADVLVWVSPPLD